MRSECGRGRGGVFSGRFCVVGMRSEAASKGVVVTVLGLAELVEEEDDGLEAQDQHDPADEAGGVEGVLLRFWAGGDRRGAGVGGRRGAGVGGSCGGGGRDATEMRIRWRCVGPPSTGLWGVPDVEVEAVEVALWVMGVLVERAVVFSVGGGAS